MPTSNLALAPVALTLIANLGARSVLDIGPGFGKYGLLIREYLNHPPDRIDAIEAEPTYVERFTWLGSVYDNVRVGDGASLTAAELAPYDLVLLFDSLEHIEKERALALLDRCPGYVAVVTPEEFFEQHVEGVPSEDHVSHWTAAEFAAMPRCTVAYTHLGAVVALLEPKGTS